MVVLAAAVALDAGGVVVINAAMPAIGADLGIPDGYPGQQSVSDKESA
ncbi:hypothetical protein AB0J14_29825 [Micromonospora arborensis]